MKRLLLLQKDPNMWRLHLDSLLHLDDSSVFFVAQGLQHFAWAHWRVLPAIDRELLVNSVSLVIARRSSSLPQYARSKVEQVLAAACALSGSLAPVLALVVEPGQPGVEAGLSALKTVLEEALSDDKRLTPDHRRQLVGEVTRVALPSVELACRICIESIQTDSPDGPLIHIAQDVLKAIVSRLPVGAHLTPQLLEVLVVLAERAVPLPTGLRSQKHSRSAIAAINILTELMGKRYIPRQANCGIDDGVDILVTLVAKVVSLLQRFKPACNRRDSADVVLPLLEFIRTFAESHLERCLSSAPCDGTMQAVVLTFLDEFSAISRCLTDVALLLNAVLVWEELVSIAPIRSLILNAEAATQVTLYFLKCCLVSDNKDLQQQCMDMVDEMNLCAIVDKDIRAIVMGASVGRDTLGVVEGAEEAGCDGTALLSHVSALVGEFMESDKFLAELRRLVPRMMDEQLADFNTATLGGRVGEDLTVHALDVLYLSRLLPICGTPESTVGRLAGTLVQLVSILAMHPVL